MTRNCAVFAAVIGGVVVLACGGTPVISSVSQPTAAVSTDDGDGVMASGMVRYAISGQLDFDASDPGNLLPPGRELVNPDGKYHYWQGDVHDIFKGDVAGPVVFHEKGVVTPDRHYIGSGPFDAEVTWNGRSGTISGQWTTNCLPDPVTVWSCDGVMTARGAGGLEGVTFKFNWGPGFYPFPYTGTAHAKQ